MNCPTCGLDFEPTEDLQCPRCGASLSCSTVTCGDCGACEGVFEQLRRTATDRLRADGGTE